MKTKEELRGLIAELEPQVIVHLDRGGQPRPLTADEKRLAVEDAEAFERVVAERQAETLDLMRKAAILDTARDDLACIEGAETAEQRLKLEAQRQKLLDARHAAATDLEAHIAMLQEALEDFQALNGHISGLDRQLGEKDRHRASHGVVAMHLKRGLHQSAPALARLAGIPFVAPKPGTSLADSFAPDPLN